MQQAFKTYDVIFSLYEGDLMNVFSKLLPAQESSSSTLGADNPMNKSSFSISLETLFLSLPTAENQSNRS